MPAAGEWVATYGTDGSNRTHFLTCILLLVPYQPDRQHWKDHKKVCGTAAGTGRAKAKQQDSGEEIVQINGRKKKSAAAPAPANQNAGSKAKLGMMDLMHPMPTTTPAVPLGGKTRFHTTFSDQVEMVEEYEAQSDELVLRKWRPVSILGAKGKWEYEIGEEERGNQGGGGSRAFRGEQR